jgi:GDP-D-mannose dehydratase
MSVQNKDGKRVLITGITGFVGAYLAKKLLS